MRVRCKTIKTVSLPEYIRENYMFGSEKFHLILNKEYLVYSITIHLNSLWYCIADESFKSYPNWFPVSIFTPTENSLSRYWYFFDETELVRIIWTFRDWGTNPGFYDRLTDGEVKEIKIFRKYKELMDLEFPDPKVTESAQLGDENWLICPKCIDAWESRNTIDALVKCPKCEKIYNNPRYDKDWRMRNNL